MMLTQIFHLKTHVFESLICFAMTRDCHDRPDVFLWRSVCLLVSSQNNAAHESPTRTNQSGGKWTHPGQGNYLLTTGPHFKTN